ncbi:SCY1-like protein 2 [Plutella xylostella]|uniref:SCY1-like protein 2 n=1 Tax=Plutella xylostella TaxID=51655 RepID=UPI002032A94B|nr:SCY1-like protein 2 [Plutella xylostella]
MASLLTKLKVGVGGGSSSSRAPSPPSTSQQHQPQGPVGPPPNESNPIMEFFEVGFEAATAGPELIWHIHDAYRKSDGKECSVFFFDKRVADKIYKNKRKETVLDRVRGCITQLEKMKHPRMLEVIHGIEEGQHTLAFASEPVLASLHNILTWHDSNPIPPGNPLPVMPYPITLGPPPATPNPPQVTAFRPPNAREYHFLDIEIRYGLMQIIEALQYLHYTCRQIHRNICPQAIIVNKRGTWKLFGLEFYENIIGPDPTEMMAVTPWSMKVAKVAQPNLDYQAPEIQTNAHCNILSDMFSLGLVICALFNNGKPIIQACNNPMLYLKQIEFLEQQVNSVLEKIPGPLQEAVQRLLNRDPHPRPTTQLLPLIKYFKCQSEVAIHAMQFLDVIDTKDPQLKINFYRVTLIEALPYIPKKLRWQHVWPLLQQELRSTEVLASVLQPVLWLANDCSHDEFSGYVLPTVKSLLESPKTIRATVTIFESLHIILRKCQRKEVNGDILPVLFRSIEHDNSQIQVAALLAMQNSSDFIDDKSLHTIVLPKIRGVLEKSQCDVKIVNLVLAFYEKILMRLERGHIVDNLLPSLLSLRLSDPEIINKVVKLYRTMLVEPKFGLTTNLMATKMIPCLAPQAVNPALNCDQFTNLMEILYDMLDNIDKGQRYKMKLEAAAHMSSPERYRNLRHQMSTDNMVAPPFNIPNLRVDTRKTSSAEDMARKNSMTAPPSGPASATGSVTGVFKNKLGLGGWLFGSNNSNNDSNFLRVSNVFPNRRLSDNTLMTPKIRIAPSCASSPGGTPGGASGLPTRRHSSIGPQERRGSAVNLSPPTGYQYRAGRGGSGSSLSVPASSHCAGGSMPNTSSSVPFLLTSSMQSIRSRRPSAAGGSHGSGILQQLSSGVVRHLPGGSSSPVHHHYGRHHHHQSHWSHTLQGATAAGYSAIQNTATMAVRKCPSLNITLSR